MVKIIGYSLRENKKGETFVALELQGDLVMAQSSTTGQFYATSKRASMVSTFDEETAKSLVGREIPGRIEKVPCEPYNYTVEETGEMVTLSHRWEYLPEGAPAPLRVASTNLAA